MLKFLYKFFGLLFLISLIPIPVSSAHALTGRDIMVMVDERDDGDNRNSVMEMTLINRRGKKRIREVLNLSVDIIKDTKKMIFFRQPYDVKGTAFLSWEYDDPKKDDDKWLYMPALRKTKRIAGESENDYFMGTDFTYDDLGDRNVDEDHHKLTGSEILKDKDCYIVESVPVDDDSYYVKKISWIIKESNIPLQCQYFDKDGLLKTYHASEIKKVDGIWTTMEMDMVNHRENHKTIMKIKDIKYNTDIDESIFTVAYIKRGFIR